MAKIQCKMCGGTLDLQEGVLSGTCNYCGNVVTFPKISDEQYENLYNRAEHFRRINEYDKAVAAYEKIVEINSDDAEAYWGLVLSRYGIEYVEDPVSHERIPTCHRVQYDSILADADYLAALEHAGSYEKGLYEAEAKRISEIQKGILAISSQEEPFDVFICYKESDDMGRRTRDSVVAQEIYYELTEAGYKVFFARITLESKIGQQYEPYIFAALNSAKAMLVIGSKKEFFEAVWVKNEWSRYLALIKKDRKKLLIPCYRDMDAYDIPEELSMFQAQDMSKIGFIQDILHGIKKVASKQTKTEVAANTQTAAAVVQGKNNPLLRRAKIFMESKDFKSALEYCDKALDQEPENGWAYFYKFLAENNYNDEDTFYKIPYFQGNGNFKFVYRFADNELKEKIKNALQRFEDERRKVVEENKRRIEEERKKAEEERKRLEEAKRKQEEARQVRIWSEASIKILERYADAWTSLNLDAEILKKIQDRIEQNRKASIFDVEQHKQATQNLISSLGNISDLENKVLKKQFRQIAIIIGISVLIIAIFVSIGVYTSSASYQYKTAKKHYEKGKHYQAVTYFEKAAEQGHIEAQYELGRCYVDGNGVSVNYDLAIKWLKNPADQGHTEAQYYLGSCYLAIREYSSAVRYLGYASDKGHVLAQNRLGLYYYKNSYSENKYRSAIYYFQKAAAQNNAESQYYLGECYEYGRGVEKNLAIAVEYYRKAEANGYSVAKLKSRAITFFIAANEKNDPEAQYEVGLCYIKGEGLLLDTQEGIKWLKKSADQGFLKAQIYLAKAFKNGVVVKIDLAQAFNYFKKAADQNDTESQYETALAYLHGKGIAKNAEEAVNYFTKSAEKGHVLSQYNLANCYYYGKGVKQNYDEAFKYYMKSAEQGIVDSQYHVGLCLEKGQGTSQNYGEALKFYQKAAAQNHAESYYRIGNFYYNGLGVAKSYEKAVSHYRSAVKFGNEDAKKALNGRIITLYIDAVEKKNAESQFVFGNCYYRGDEVEKSLNEAISYWTMAAEQNYIEAQYLLAKLYFQGKEVEKNFEKSIFWMTRAADLGKCEAQYYLAVCYFGGVGVEKNYETAVKYFTMAAKQNHAESQYYLGFAYHHGRGVAEDLDTAAYWYLLAAEQNHEKAKKVLDIDTFSLFKEAEVGVNAQYEIAMKYKDGRGLIQSDEKAVKYFGIASNHGHAESQYELGKCYYWGRGVEQNDLKAVEYFSMAVANGSIDALFELANCYYWGRGVAQQDRAKAIELYQQAADKGHAEAEKVLQRITQK